MTLLLLLLVFGVVGISVLVSQLNRITQRLGHDQQDYAELVQAKEALIAWALVGNPNPGRLPFPDVLDPAESGPALNYNGDANGAGCLSSGWTAAGAPLARNSAAVRCLGRLPWRTLGLDLRTPSEADPAGVMPWYAVSANLLMPCFALNSGMLDWTYPGSYACNPGQLQYPWLTVRDGKGNILSNRVALVLLMPGAPLGAQVRSERIPPSVQQLAGPAAYLDSLTVLPGCTRPCVPGTYSNARLNPGNEFIQGLDRSQVDARDPGFAHPYHFNDKLVYVTIDELMAALERRAATEARRALVAFFAAKRYYPHAADLGSSGGNCSAGNRRGMLPTAVGGCGAGDFLGGPPGSALPAWFGANDWQNYIYYTVAQACAPGTSNCGGSGFLTVGTRTGVEALAIATGKPILSPPPASKGSAQTGWPSATLADYLDTTQPADAYERLGYPRTNIYNDQIFIVSH